MSGWVCATPVSRMQVAGAAKCGGQLAPPINNKLGLLSCGEIGNELHWLGRRTQLSDVIKEIKR